MTKSTKHYKAADGTDWGVDVQSPGASNALVFFRHPDGRSSRLDRYNWIITSGPESRNVTARLDPDTVLSSLSDESIRRLFQRSMPVSRRDPLTQAPEVIAG